MRKMTGTCFATVPDGLSIDSMGSERQRPSRFYVGKRVFSWVEDSCWSQFWWWLVLRPVFRGRRSHLDLRLPPLGWSMRVRGLGGRKRAERLVRRWRGWRSGRTRLGPAMPTSELLRERVLARLNTWRCARLCRKFRLWSCTRCMVMRRWSFVACVATISLGTGLVAGLPSLALAQSGWFAGNLYVSPSSACFEYARNRPGECSCRSGKGGWWFACDRVDLLRIPRAGTGIRVASP